MFAPASSPNFRVGGHWPTADTSVQNGLCSMLHMSRQQPALCMAFALAFIVCVQTPMAQSPQKFALDRSVMRTGSPSSAMSGHGVEAVGQPPPGYITAFTSISQRNLGVSAQGHELLSAIETVFPAPEPAASRSDEEVQAAAIRELVGLFGGFWNDGSRYRSTPRLVSPDFAPKMEDTPTSGRKSTPNCTPIRDRLQR